MTKKGRPRKYPNDAAKQAAYRDRKRRRETVLIAKPITPSPPEDAPETTRPSGYAYLTIGKLEAGAGGRMKISATNEAMIQRLKEKGWIEVTEDKWNELEDRNER
jgi:hypothetical protein